MQIASRKSSVRLGEQSRLRLRGWRLQHGSNGGLLASVSVKVRGPFAVYGNFASSVNVEKLLKEKQTISYEVARDWSDKTSMRLEGRFMIDSELFDRNLLKFLDAFNLKISDQDSKVVTRNNILLGIARVLRMNNERVVE